MFVFVKSGKSVITDYFGPATPGECRSWIRIKKLRPKSIHEPDDSPFGTILEDAPPLRMLNAGK